MTLFKPRVGKVIFAQTTGGLSVIIPKFYFLYVFKIFRVNSSMFSYLGIEFMVCNFFVFLVVAVGCREKLRN